MEPVALGRRAAADSAGFLGTLGTLKAAWAEDERFPSTLSSSSKLRSERHTHRQTENVGLVFQLVEWTAKVSRGRGVPIIFRSVSNHGRRLTIHEHVPFDARTTSNVH